MKTLKLSLVSALIAISSSAFAGNLENCCGTQTQESEAMLTLETSEMNQIYDSAVKGILHGMTTKVREQMNKQGVEMILDNMTSRVRQQVNDGSVEMLLQDMTKQVQERVRTAPSNGSSL